MSSADPGPRPAILSCIIVGGGPGGLGPLVWAAQHGELHAWLERGIAVVESTRRLGGSLGRYGINSDSLGGSYLECLGPEGLPEAMRRLRDDPVTREMRAYHEDFPPLPLVDRYMARIGHALAETAAAHPSSRIHLATTARSLHLRSDGTVAVFVHGPEGHAATLVARSAVVAVGGQQPWRDQTLMPGVRIEESPSRRVMPSNAVLTHEGLAQASDTLRRAGGRRIVVLGGSHSAYAVAWALLRLPGAAGLADGQIAIAQRRPPRVFYPDRAAALADRYPVEPGDICQRTQRVNRMGGLRGHGRDIWRQITERPNADAERRVSVLDLGQVSSAGIHSLLDEAALVVPCLGYRSATLPILDSTGRRLALRADGNGAGVADDCRVALADGTRLPNVFGIGLGSGFRPSLAMGCEPNFDGQANSLWLYQNDIGGLIYRGVHEEASALAA